MRFTDADGHRLTAFATSTTGVPIAALLDQWRVIDAEAADDVAMMRPLTDREVRAWVSGGRPTRAEWIDALDSGLLAYPGRGCGRCTVLYLDGRPSEVGYWGATAD